MMALAPAELAAQLRQTAGFIDADPSILSAERRTRLRVPGGGMVGSAEPATISWRCRLIPSPGVKPSPLSSAAPTADVVFILLALPTMDILAGDTFTYEGRSYVVSYVDDTKDYELKSEVIAHV